MRKGSHNQRYKDVILKTTEGKSAYSSVCVLCYRNRTLLSKVVKKRQKLVICMMALSELFFYFMKFFVRFTSQPSFEKWEIRYDYWMGKDVKGENEIIYQEHVHYKKNNIQSHMLVLYRGADFFSHCLCFFLLNNHVKTHMAAWLKL